MLATTIMRRRFYFFIVTDNIGSTQEGCPYLSNYPDQITNSAILPIARPLVMSMVFLLLISLTPTTNQVSLIWHWRSSGLLGVFGFGDVQQLLWD